MSIQLTGERATKADLLRQQLAALEQDERNARIKERKERDAIILDCIPELKVCVIKLLPDSRHKLKFLEELDRAKEYGYWESDYDIKIELVERPNLE